MHPVHQRLLKERLRTGSFSPPPPSHNACHVMVVLQSSLLHLNLHVPPFVCSRNILQYYPAFQYQGPGVDIWVAHTFVSLTHTYTPTSLSVLLSLLLLLVPYLFLYLHTYNFHRCCFSSSLHHSQAGDSPQHRNRPEIGVVLTVSVTPDKVTENKTLVPATSGSAHSRLCQTFVN